MISPYLCIYLFIVVVVLAVGAFLSVATRKLTPMAGLSAFFVGIGIFSGAGPVGLAALAVFFIMATWATAHKKEQKARLEAKPRHPERRKAGQVFANGGIAALLGIIGIFSPEHHATIIVMMLSAISAATADTLSSELGMVYGRNAFNILTLKKEDRGLDGVISIEGTLIGIVGSVLIGCIYCAFTGFDARGLLIIIAAGTAGNLADSLLGALLERKHIINNNIVNTLNTLTGATIALALIKMLMR